MVDYAIKKHDYLKIPHALVAYNSNTLYHTYTILENQLEQIEPSTSVYKEIDALAQRIFDTWIFLGFAKRSE